MTTSNSATLPEFVLFGDSLTEWGFSDYTQGYGLFFEQKYKQKSRILNEGQAGYTSSSIKRDFDRVIARATAPNASPTLLFTILLGANDACIIGKSEYVPYPKFEANIRAFIETILTQDAMPNTKIVLITPPPIAIPKPSKSTDGMTAEEIEEANYWLKEGPSYKTYMSKKRYAEGCMRIAFDYAETERVVGLDLWRGLADTRLAEIGSVYDETLLPGSGLHGAEAFGKGYFTDGLHLDVKGYNVLSTALFEIITQKWPELAPERL